MTDPVYKTAMNTCYNAFATEEGAWVRRSGFRFLAHTRGGAYAKLAAFDFSVTQPYQLEFTNGYLRFFAGLSLVTTLAQDGTVFISEVTNTNPAKVVFATAIPAGWSNGNQIIFTLPSIPCTCPKLLNRQFVLANKSTVDHSFTLKDPITGVDVDATGYGYTPGPAGSVADSVQKIFERVTPYGLVSLPSLRLVTDDTTVLILNNGYQPRVLTQAAPWDIDTQDFVDGPYLDINETTTTLTPSGTSGTVTMTASSTVGINDGAGFQSTDVGRLLRFQGAPAAWASGTTYAKDALVAGSDGNFYISQTGSNIGHDPTTDTGTNWLLSSATGIWVWGTITVVSSTVAVSVALQTIPVDPGDDASPTLSGTAASTVWRLGLYSDTIGWPTCGCYHEGRLWLSAISFGNRVDASKSNNHFVFSPTGYDGTVADNNAIAATANAVDVNAIFWMISTDDGLVLGTQAGEWRIRASALDDPISPTSIQMRRVSKWGCADIEPVQASQNIFVQRLRRKLLAHMQVTDTKYSAENLSHLSDHLISSGVEEIRWQQEPALTIWSRCKSGDLVGTVFQKGYNTWSRTGGPEESFGAFFQAPLADNRFVESISSGPTYDGLSDALYLVSNQTDPTASDYNVRWVQCIMPVFDDSQLDWSALYTDGGANPTYAQRYAIANGDSFDGIRIFGLWNLNGRTVTPVLGGLDLGDHVVANGYTDVPFASDPDKNFTSTFFTGLSNGTNYDVYAVSAGYVQTFAPLPSPHAANTLLGLVGADTAYMNGSGDRAGFVDAANNRFISIQNTSGAIRGGARSFNVSTGAETLQADEATTFGNAVSLGPWAIGTTYNVNDVVTGSDGRIYKSLSGGNTGNDPISFPSQWYFDAPLHGWGPTSYMLHRNGFIYGSVGAGNSVPFTKVNATTFVEDSHYGSTSATMGLSVSGRLCWNSRNLCGPRMPLSNGTFKNYVVFVGIFDGAHSNGVTLIDADVLNFRAAWATDEAYAAVCCGPERVGYTSWYVIGTRPLGAAVQYFDPATTYAASTEVFASDGHIYASLQDANTGNDPVSSPTWWSDEGKAIGFYQCYFQDASAFQHRKFGTVGPLDIDPTWQTIAEVIGPAFDQSDGTLLALIGTNDTAPVNKTYLVKFRSGDASIVWKVALPSVSGQYSDLQTFSALNINGKMAFVGASSSPDHNAYIVDTTTGALTVQPINTGFIFSTPQIFDPNSGSVTFFGAFTYNVVWTPAMFFIGTYLPAHGNALGNQWGRLYLGDAAMGPTKLITEYEVPLSIGTAFTSKGQLLRPDFGPDAGARNGPAFGKLRRIHKWAMSFWRSRGVSIGTDFAKLHPVIMRSPGKTPISSPTLYSGIISDTLENDDSFDAQIAWQITRPYPATVLAAGGYIESSDK